MQTTLHVTAVEALNPAAYVSIQGHSWHPHGANISEANPLWVAIGYREGKLNVRLAVPITLSEAGSIIADLLNANGNPAETQVKEDPIKVWSLTQVVPEPE